MTDSDQRLADYSYVEVDFSPDPGFQLQFDGLHGHEELGRPFFYEVDLSSGKLRGNLSTLIGSSATVWISQAKETAPDRFLHGIVTRVIAAGLSGGTYRYRVELRPWIWLLSRRVDCRIFQQQSAFAIVTGLFREAGFSDFEDHRRNAAGETTLEYCVQYRESTLDFVTRLMEQFGIYYFFKHERGKHTLMLADDPNSHAALDDPLPFRFDQTEHRSVDDHIWEWSTDLALQSGKVTMRDYNFTTPSADLTAKTVDPGPTPHGLIEVYEYPGPYQATDDGQKLTDVCMQAISSHRATFRGSSNARALRAGWKFTLERYPDTALNRDYLILRHTISMTIAEGAANAAGENVDTWRVVIEAVPADVIYRLPRSTPRPMIRGPQTARVVGTSGDEITTDQYGRVKVRFHWDRSETQDDQRTCWIRVAQAWAGSGFGALFIPRVGQEVVVEFLEGNPDRPLITGSVYNANVQAPYDLPGRKTLTTIRSNTTPGGGKANELRFEDNSGSEELYLQAAKDMTVSVKNNSTTTVEQGDRAVTVSQGKDSLTVSTGDHSITVSTGGSTITAAQSITLKVGANSVVIDTSGVTINGTSVTLQGQSSVSVTAPSIALN